MKYVSDKYAGDPYALIQVPDGGSFDDLVALKGKKEIGDQTNKIIGRLAEVNDLEGVINLADFNDEDKLGKGKEMVDRLSRLIGIFERLDLSANRAAGENPTCGRLPGRLSGREGEAISPERGGAANPATEAPGGGTPRQNRHSSARCRR